MSRGPGNRQRAVLAALQEPCSYGRLLVRLLGRRYTHAGIAELSATQRAIRTLRKKGFIQQTQEIRVNAFGPMEYTILSVAKNVSDAKIDNTYK